jgi:hypothetical protein
MLFSLGTTMNVSIFFDLQHLAAVGSIEYLSAPPGNKKPPATVSREAVFSLISRADSP